MKPSINSSPSHNSETSAQKDKPRFWVVIPAAGIGKRFNSSLPKQYLKIDGLTVIEHILHCFLSLSFIEKIVVAIAPEDKEWSQLSFPSDVSSKIAITSGGKERIHSVLNGLHYLKPFAKPGDWVLVHDAVRPCVDSEDINKLIDQLIDHAVGGLLAVPVRDTMKRANEQQQSMETVSRTDLWHALTPQMFRFNLLFAALETAIVNNFSVTDEAAAIEYAGEIPQLVAGKSNNIKLTYPEDIKLAEMYLQQRGCDANRSRL